MKLKNKQTGEIKEVIVGGYPVSGKTKMWECSEMDANEETGYKSLGTYTSLAGLNKEWEDMPEEPKERWYINENGGVMKYVPFDPDGEDLSYMKYQNEIGNCFDTREEAEKAVEKLKAMAKLKEFGFRFIDWELDMKTIADGKIWFDVGVNTEWDAEQLLELKPEAKELLDILFSQEGD